MHAMRCMRCDASHASQPKSRASCVNMTQNPGYDSATNEIFLTLPVIADRKTEVASCTRSGGDVCGILVLGRLNTCTRTVVSCMYALQN